LETLDLEYRAALLLWLGRVVRYMARDHNHNAKGLGEGIQALEQAVGGEIQEPPSMASESVGVEYYHIPGELLIWDEGPSHMLALFVALGRFAFPRNSIESLLAFAPKWLCDMVRLPAKGWDMMSLQSGSWRQLREIFGRNSESTRNIGKGYDAAAKIHCGEITEGMLKNPAGGV